MPCQGLKPPVDGVGGASSLSRFFPLICCWAKKLLVSGPNELAESGGALSGWGVLAVGVLIR